MARSAKDLAILAALAGTSGPAEGRNRLTLTLDPPQLGWLARGTDSIMYLADSAISRRARECNPWIALLAGPIRLVARSMGMRVRE